MKKLLLIMLTFFYFGTSSGVVFKLHECLGKMQIFGGNSDESCNTCHSKTKKDCCKTVFKVLKTSDAQKAELLKFDVLKYVSLKENTTFFESFSKILTSNYSSVQINAPPDNREVALFISHCNFRI